MKLFVVCVWPWTDPRWWEMTSRVLTFLASKTDLQTKILLRLEIQSSIFLCLGANFVISVDWFCCPQQCNVGQCNLKVVESLR